MNNIYRHTPLDRIPWNIETPPNLLVKLVDSGKVRPCKAVDLGCGAGNYAIYLAGRGFEMTGVDFSPAAIKIAKQNAAAKGIKCSFRAADIVEGLNNLKQKWDFAYDWGVLHHIFPKDRPKYVRNVRRILNDNAKYLSVCFSEKDTAFEGSGKFRKTSTGSTLYFSSENELKKLFGPYFKILDQQTVELPGKFDPHVFNYLFMQKK